MFYFCPQVCLTIDHWSSHRRGYVGFTAHWIGEESSQNKPKHACIALRRVVGRCTFDILADLIDSVLTEFQLHKKVTHCVTDSGSNFVKAFKEFTVKETDNSEDSTVVDEELDPLALIPTALSDILDEAPDEGVVLPAHFRCAVHRLNLVGSNDCEAALENSLCKRVYRSLMAKVTEIFNKQSRSTLASDKIYEALGELFQVHNSTRWNSLYDALAKVMSFLDEKPTQLHALFTDFQLRPITPEECLFLKEFQDAMKPLATTLDLLQGDGVSIGFLLPALHDMLEQWHKLREAPSTPLKYTNPLISHLITSVKTRFNVELNSKEFMIAAAIHPQFRMHWVPDEITDDVIAATRNYLSNYNSDG